MSAPRNPTGPATGVAGSMLRLNPRVRVCRLTGVDLTLWGLVGLRWSWSCRHPLCTSWSFGTAYDCGYSASWESAYLRAEQHARRFHTGTLNAPRPTGS